MTVWKINESDQSTYLYEPESSDLDCLLEKFK